MLVVRLLGNFEVMNDAPGASSRLMPLQQALLAYLVLNPERLHTRATLIQMFWEDVEPMRARRALNTALWRVRAAIEPDGVHFGNYLTTGPDGVRFCGGADAWIDAVVFQRQLQSVQRRSGQSLSTDEIAGLTGALDLYAGDLLDGMYWDWLAPERERLRLMYLDGLTVLMHAHACLGAYSDAIRCGQRIVDLDPMRESVHRDVMRLHCAAGQRGLALRQYMACRKLLQDELLIAPMPSTRQLYEAILAGDATAPGAWGGDSLRTAFAGAPGRSSAASARIGPLAPEREAARHDLAQLGIDLDEVLRLMDKQALRPLGAA